MWVLPIKTFLEMDDLEPHQALLQKGLMRQWQPGMRAIFVSHQVRLCGCIPLQDSTVRRKQKASEGRKGPQGHDPKNARRTCLMQLPENAYRLIVLLVLSSLGFRLQPHSHYVVAECHPPGPKSGSVPRPAAAPP